MANKTVINKTLSDSASTQINYDIVEQYNQQNSVETDYSQMASEGTELLGKYKIVRQLEVNSGESNLYLCKNGAAEYVAKVYLRKAAIKQEVIKKLKTIDSPFVAKLFETGTVNGYPVEILPYYEKGSLQGKTFSFDELRDTIIPNINEGLHAIHKAGIIHKDLKPTNLMLNDDGRTISIIDFGISSAIQDETDIKNTKTGMTPEYSAPETFLNLFFVESDYYSFGITLFELFSGYTPFAGMQLEEIQSYASLQRLPFPEDMPMLLQNFISALTYKDLQYRDNKSNPNRRWTYDEVKRWLSGENLVIPGEGIGNVGKGTMPAFLFLGTEYTDPVQLVEALAKNWEEGKKQLFRGHITNHFRYFNQELYRKCQAAEEAAVRENGKDDIIFWRLLYQINPKLEGFYWDGQVFESLPAFGRDILNRLWNKDESQFAYYKSVLSEKLLSQYISMVMPKSEAKKKVVSALEDSYELEVINQTDFRRTYYLMGYTLSGQKLFQFDGEQFRTVGELYGYMRETMERSFEEFEDICHRLVNYDGTLDFQLETWLIAIGKQKEIDKWRESMNG